MKYLRLFIVVFAMVSLLGCSAEKNRSIASEDTSVRVEQVRPEKHNGHFLIYLLLVMSTCGSVMYTYKISKELEAYRKKMHRGAEHKSRSQVQEISDEKIREVKNDVYIELKRRVDEHIEELNQKVSELKNASSSKNDTMRSVQQSYFVKRETSHETAAPNKVSFRDEVDEYNYFINSGKSLPSTFVELKNYVADNGRLVERTTGEVLLYMVDDHVFPSDKISNSIALSWIGDAFIVAGKGKNVFVEQPCTVRKMNREYEIVEKRIVKLN